MMLVTAACFLPLLAVLVPSTTAQEHHTKLSINGHHLPNDFIYGCGTSAYQIEGAWNEDGKGESIWDKYTHQKGKDHVANDDTGNVAMDFYHTYKKDIPLFFDALGVNNYDFTLSWTRILPKGRGEKANHHGINFYRKVAETVHKQGGSTSCTLYHWDLPQVLQDEYDGWLNHKIVKDFANYAEIAMSELGDVCDRWISMNEPRTFCVEGYSKDDHEAPGKPVKYGEFKCVHHALLAHGHAHRIWKKLKKQGKVKGTWGIKLDGSPLRPLRKGNELDFIAAVRGMDFELGWTAAPLTTGDYPPIMRKTMGKHLPSFTKEESELIKASLGVLYYDVYTSAWAKHQEEDCPEGSDNWPLCVEEQQEYPEDSGHFIGKQTGSEWNFQVNDTIIEGLNFFVHRWGAKEVVIGENGLALFNSDKLSPSQQINDGARIDWYRNTFRQIDIILKEGKIDLKGFVPWSCISNFEWSGGYGADFGLIYSKPGKDKKRTPKKSAAYLKGVMTEGQHSGHLEKKKKGTSSE